MAGQAQGIAVACHYVVGVAEAAHGVAVADDHRAELAVFVVTVLSQGFDRFVVHHPLDVGQPAQRMLVMQVHAGAAALGAHQVHLLVRVVDAFARLQGHERHHVPVCRWEMRSVA